MLFNSPTQFYGDDIRWWYGMVQEVASDPIELGRARVRIFGIHGPLIQDQDLPWASVVLPTTSGGVSGVGTTPWLQPTARVIGIFLDGKNSQLPVILGAIPSFEGDINSTEERGTRGGRVGRSVSSGQGNQGGSQTFNTNFSGTDAEAQATITQVFRELSTQEFNNLISAINAEASPNQQEQAWVAGVIINRARKRNQTIMQVLSAPYQFHAVTGASGRGPPSRNFVNGPSESRRKSIYGSITNYLRQVPRDVYYFDSNIPGAYKDVGGITKFNNVARDRQRNGGTLKVVGQSRFWPGVSY